jgi:hypothetical protein
MFASHNVPTPNTIYDTFMLYKRVSEQYVNQDVLDYVRILIPEEIINKTTIESKEEPLKSVLQWFKKDFMRWTPKDPKCDTCNLPMALQFIKGISWKLRSTEKYTCSSCGTTTLSFPRYGGYSKNCRNKDWKM